MDSLLPLEQHQPCNIVHYLSIFAKIILVTTLLVIRIATGYAQSTTLVDSLDGPIALTSMGDELFIAVNGNGFFGGQVWSHDLTGPHLEKRLLMDSLNAARALLAVDHSLYIATRDRLLRLDLQNRTAPPDTLIEESSLFIRSILHRNNVLYLATSDGIKTLDLTDQEAGTSSLTRGGLDDPLSMAFHHNLLYYAKGNQINSYNLETGEIQTIISGLRYKVYSIVIHNDLLYLDQGNLDYIEDRIIAYDLNNLASRPEVFCDQLNSVIGMYIKDDVLYSNSTSVAPYTRSSGTVYRIDKPLLESRGFQSNGDLIIYPNPTANTINIRGGTEILKTLSIYDSSGALVSSQPYTEQVDLSPLTNGVYHIVFQNMMGTALHKQSIIKM